MFLNKEGINYIMVYDMEYSSFANLVIYSYIFYSYIYKSIHLYIYPSVKFL